MISKKDRKNLVEVLKNARIPENIPVNYIRGKKKNILKYSPFTSNRDYYTRVERARILDIKGKCLYGVDWGYFGRYGGMMGETIKEALEKLKNRISSAKYVLVIGKDVVDGTINGQGVFVRNKEFTLYEL